MGRLLQHTCNLLILFVVAVALGDAKHALLSCLQPPNAAPSPPGTRRYYRDLRAGTDEEPVAGPGG